MPIIGISLVTRNKLLSEPEFKSFENKEVSFTINQFDYHLLKAGYNWVERE